MRTYPSNFPVATIGATEQLVEAAVKLRLGQDGWNWDAPGYFLSTAELNEIRLNFGLDVQDDQLLKFVGMVFSRVMPELHLAFTSDGYLLDYSNRGHARVVVVSELPPCFSGYDNPRRQASRQAAEGAVRSIVEWRLATYREVHPGQYWPVGVTGSADLIFGEIYSWIKHLGDFGYCRTRYVVDFLYAAIPEIRAEWEEAGLTLVPIYHVVRSGRERFITLRLTPA